MTQEAIAKGMRAQKWLEDETTKFAFEGVKKAIYDEWARLDIDDTQNQTRLKLMLGLLESYRP